MNLQETFDKFEDEYLKFDRIPNKRSLRPDLHAFLLLDSLQPGTLDMVGSASHDETFLSPDVEALAKVITEDQVLELVRCGVRYESNYDCLTMFV